MATKAAAGPLDGVRVIDFTRHMAGPLGTQTLADYGADVVKVEALPGGDPMRHSGAYYVGDESAFYLSYNRNKRSVALDLRSPEGLDLARRLIDEADVVAENYRPGIADRIGIGYEAARQRNPRVVYVSVTGFGQTGPYADYPGTDALLQALSGVMSVTGPSDGDPMLAGIPVCDLTGAAQLVQGVTMALFARERSGVGQHVDVSLQRGLVGGLTTRLASYWFGGEDSARYGSAHSAVVPFQAFRTADGFVVAAAPQPGDWPRFCTAIARPDLTEDPRFATNTDRLERRGELTALLDQVFSKATTEEWMERFRAADAQLAPILTIAQAIAHPQLQHCGLVQSVEHDDLGPIPQLAPTIGLSETPGSVRTAPPVLGAHTVEVLTELGCSDGQITEWLRAGIAAAPASTSAAPTP